MQVVLGYLHLFRRNTLLKCVMQTKIAKNSIKSPILGVQGHSRSSMLTPLSSSLLLLVISSMSEPICNHFDAKQANSRKIFFFSFEGTSLTQRHKILL